MKAQKWVKRLCIATILVHVLYILIVAMGLVYYVHVDNPAMMVRDGGIIVPFVVLVKPCVLMIYVLLFTVLLMTCPKISAKLMLLFAIIGRGFIGFYNLLNTHLYAIMSNDNVSYYDYFIMEKRIESYVSVITTIGSILFWVALGIAIGRQETEKSIS